MYAQSGVIPDGAGLLKTIPEISRPMDDDTGRHDTAVILRLRYSKESRMQRLIIGHTFTTPRQSG